MDQQHPRWITPSGLLLLNLIGWVAFYIVMSSTVARPVEKPTTDAADRDALARTVDARLAALESHMQQLGDQLNGLASRMQPRADDVGRRLSQAELRRLESTTARLEEELGNLTRRTHVTVDLNALVQSLRPNVSFGLLRITPTKPGVVDLTFQMRNLGGYAVTVDAPEIALAARPFADSGPGETLLVPGQQYTVRADPVETLLPSESKNFTYTVVLNDPRRLANPLYYRATFRTSTDPAVVATSTGLLKGKLPEKDIRGLSVAQYAHVGEITAGLQRP